MNRASTTLVASLVALIAACRPSTAPAPRPAPSGANRPPSEQPREAQGARNRPDVGPLPPVPFVEGPVFLRVVYPAWNQMLTSKDSTFVLGSVGNGKVRLTINGADVRVWPNGAFLGWVSNPPPTAPRFDLIARLGPDSATMSHQVRVAGMLPPPPDTAKPPTVTDTTPTWIIVRDTSASLPDTDRVVIGRPVPNTTYRWFLLPGTRVQLTGRYPGFARIRLDSGLEVWIENQDAKQFSPDTTPPKRVAGNVRVRPAQDYVDVMIPVNERPPYLVEERDKSLELTLYSTRGNTDLVNYPTSDSLVRHIEWTQELNDRARYSVELNSVSFGYLVLYENGWFILRVRRPPPAATRRGPLAGLTIAVDAGHPPAGANGPTGLYEGDATLPVAQKLQEMLEQRGATVIMTRTTRDAVDLAMRSVIARRNDAHAFVSIHYNAYPDGVNPFQRPNGAEVYFYRPHSESLARAVQSEIIERQPLADQGVHFRSLAVVRSTWFPAILAEGGFLMIPEQEYAMRGAEWQERYARAIADGLEKYFRALRSR